MAAKKPSKTEAPKPDAPAAPAKPGAPPSADPKAAPGPNRPQPEPAPEDPKDPKAPDDAGNPPAGHGPEDARAADDDQQQDPHAIPSAAVEIAKPDGAPPTTAPKAGSMSKSVIDNLYFGVAERSLQESVYDRATQYKPYNSDDLYQRTGDYSTYEDMLNDDQITACLTIKKDLVLASGWDIVLEDDEAGGDNGGDEIKKDIERALREDPLTSLDDCLEEVISAYEFGFSLSEKVFQIRDDGTLALKWLKTRAPNTWLIHTDKQGNVERYEQRNRDGNIDIEPKSLIHYVNNPKFGNPYGRSDLRSAYAAWMVKRQVIRYYAIYLEKAASPTPVAKYHKDAPAQAVDDLHNAIKALQAKTALTIPKDIEIEFLECKTNGEAYTKAINILNMFIGRCLIIPDLLGFQGAETSGGSFSLGQDQMRVMFKHLQRRRERLERIVNNDLIRPIVHWNHGLVENLPKFRLRPIRDEDAIDLAKLWIELSKGKLYEPSDEEINHIRGIVRFPQGDVERAAAPAPGAVDPVTGLPVPGALPGVDPNDPNAVDPNADPDADPVDPTDPDAPAQDPEKPVPPKPGKPGAAPAPLKPGAQSVKKFARRVYDLPPGEYAKKVDFAAAESHLDRFQSRVMDQAQPLVKRIYDDLFEQIERKGILKNQAAGKIDELKLKYLKELKLILKRNLREAYQDAGKMGQRELMKGNYRTPLPDEAFLEFLETESFQYVGDWAYNVTKKARQALIEAIRDGNPLSAVIDLLDDAGVKDSLVSLERYARTKFTDVTNRGRLAFFNESGVVAAYQFAAVLDDRTTDICDGLHGKIFKAGDEPVPPLHFNCRSLLVPITKYEDWEADEKVGKTPIDQFIDDNKGDGFSRR